MKFLNKKVNAYNIAEVHQFPRNSVMEFTEYLQWDRLAPFFLRHPSRNALLNTSEWRALVITHKN